MTIWLYTGDRPSSSAQAICQNPGFKRLRTGKAVKAEDSIVYWGTSKVGPVSVEKMFNDPQAVARAANKFQTFSSLAGASVPTVPWTANMAVAKEWKDDKATIVARTTLTGHSGAGIIIVEEGDELIEAPLYTKYIFKVKEYRVHATVQKVIDTQQKVREPGVEVKSWKVRSHDNGFIFQRKNIESKPQRDILAINSIRALGLDFGAVDIVEDKAGYFYVLEVNTAPGLEGQTITNYVEALAELVNA